MKLHTNRILLDFMHVCEPKNIMSRILFMYGELISNKMLSCSYASHEGRQGKCSDSPAHLRHLHYAETSVEWQPHTSLHPRLYPS